MKHIPVMLKPHSNPQDTSAPKIEFDYLRLIYAVSQIRKQGDSAQGYFVLTDVSMLNRLGQLERDYSGKEYARVLSVSSDSYLRHTERIEKTEILSGMVRAAILNTGDSPSAANIRRSIRELILSETILGLEPDARHVQDEKRFPFTIHWDYYGVVEDDASNRHATDTANYSAIER